jgi:hypothetical protein
MKILFPLAQSGRKMNIYRITICYQYWRATRPQLQYFIVVIPGAWE